MSEAVIVQEELYSADKLPVSHDNRAKPSSGRTADSAFQFASDGYRTVRHDPGFRSTVAHNSAVGVHLQCHYRESGSHAFGGIFRCFFHHCSRSRMFQRWRRSGNTLRSDWNCVLDSLSGIQTSVGNPRCRVRTTQDCVRYIGRSRNAEGGDSLSARTIFFTSIE